MREIPYNHEPGNIPPSLAKVPFLSNISSDCLDEILTHTSIVECEPGDAIITEGEKTEGAPFFILLKGSLLISKAGKEITRIDTAGELIGELALLNTDDSTDLTRSATASALENAYCIKVDSKFLNDLSDAERQAYYAVLYRFLAQVMTERLKQADARIAELENVLAGSQSGTNTYNL
ncbi:MAG: cyclic nucleotide-binding domain-containing protein [Verrucomicrobiota bacterium]